MEFSKMNPDPHAELQKTRQRLKQARRAGARPSRIETLRANMRTQRAEAARYDQGKEK